MTLYWRSKATIVQQFQGRTQGWVFTLSVTDSRLEIESDDFLYHKLEVLKENKICFESDD